MTPRPTILTALRHVARVVTRVLRVSTVAAAMACANSNDVRVALDASPVPNDARRVAIRAQLIGPPAGLRYRWFSVSGNCNPQSGGTPATEFRFGPGTLRDRVTVEVWRDSTRVARAEVDLRLDPRGVGAVGELYSDVRVAITTVPPYDASGGPDTRASIAGRAEGQGVRTLKVVLYAHADAWYVQPTPGFLLTIGPDGRWASWTHTGSSYAALVVHPTFDPPARLDLLPEVGGVVLARTIVEGARR